MNEKEDRIKIYRELFQSCYDVPTIRVETMADKLYLNAMVPVLMEYISWVLKEAAISGKKRLYFLARDGYQMYLAAKHLTAKWDLDIECCYLSVSRYAMRVPEYHLLGDRCLERICVGGIDVTFEKICKRAALTEEEILEVVKRSGLEDQYKNVLNYREVQLLKETLKKNSYFMECIKKHSEEAYPSAMSYLEQEGLLEHIPYAFVDSGWVGTLQQTIQNLIATRDSSIKVEGYYFGMYEYPKGTDRNTYHTFYFSPLSKLERKVYFSNCLYEAIFSAAEGMTLRYQEQEGRYIPILDFNHNPNMKQIRRNIQILEEFLEKYKEKNNKDKKIDGNTNLLSEHILKKFMGKPTEIEVGAYGDTLFSDDVLEGHLQKVSAELSQEEIKKQRFLSKIMIMTGIRKDVICESAWIEGSIKKNGVNVAWNLRHAHFYKYFIYIRKWIQQGGRRE